MQPMPRKLMWLRVGAVVCSLGLLGTYVACKSMSAAKEGGTAAAGELGNEGADQQKAGQQKEPEGSVEFFGGSKSGVVFKPQQEEKPRPHMGGSKSLAPIISPSDLKKAEQPSQTQQPK